MGDEYGNRNRSERPPYPTKPDFQQIDRAGRFGADHYWTYEKNPYGSGYFAIEIPSGDKIFYSRESYAREWCARQNIVLNQEAFKSVLIRWGMRTDESKPVPETATIVVDSYRKHDYNLDLGAW